LAVQLVEDRDPGLVAIDRLPIDDHGLRAIASFASQISGYLAVQS
jgi:hypothetical protein